MNDITTTAMGQLEKVLISGDLSTLKADDRVMYYNAVCKSVGLNPLTKPFEYITLNGKLTLYARRDATDQLRNIHKVSIEIKSREVVEDCYVVTACASTPIRSDESIGAVSIANLKGEARANAMMKAETKAKRRVTLSICGLGMLDETEVETIPSARITPTAGAADSLNPERQEFVHMVAGKVAEWISSGSIADAIAETENAHFDSDEMIYFWTLFDSKQRSAMKKERERQRTTPPQVENKLVMSVITEQQHKRLEARIADFKLDREMVKKYVKDIFGKDHFTELTRDDYDKLDQHLEVMAMAAPPSDLITDETVVADIQSWVKRKKFDMAYDLLRSITNEAIREATKTRIDAAKNYVEQRA